MKLKWNWTDFTAALLAAPVVCILLISGCGAESAKPIANPRELHGRESMEYVNFDGHEYVKYASLEGSIWSIGGITHSPKCHCMSNK